jgi:very-short-patch-repair endonuclease
MRDKKFYQREYYDEAKSIRQIATEQETYPSKIYREIKSLGLKIKSKSEVQKVRLETIPHPTEGKPRTDDEKRKIGKSLSNNWKTLSASEIKDRIEGNLLNFKTMSKTKRQEIQKLAIKEIKKTAKTGSKVERFFLAKLNECGYHTTIHKEIPLKEKLVVDLMLVEHNIVIEVDGISHYEPIWGDDKLLQQQAADKEKDAILLSCGYTVIRFRLTQKAYNLTKMFDALDIIKKTVENIISSKGKQNGVIYVDDATV